MGAAWAHSNKSSIALCPRAIRLSFIEQCFTFEFIWTHLQRTYQAKTFHTTHAVPTFSGDSSVACHTGAGNASLICRASTARVLDRCAEPVMLWKWPKLSMALTFVRCSPRTSLSAKRQRSNTRFLRGGTGFGSEGLDGAS